MQAERGGHMSMLNSLGGKSLSPVVVVPYVRPCQRVGVVVSASVQKIGRKIVHVQKA